MRAVIKKVIAGAATAAIVGGSYLIGDTYFSDSEFASPDDFSSHEQFDPVLRAQLDTLRHDMGKPIRVNSAVRTKVHNRRVGGVANSSHTAPCYCAVDIHAPTSSDKFFIVKWALEHGFNRIGIGSNFIHLDRDTSKQQAVIWTY